MSTLEKLIVMFGGMGLVCMVAAVFVLIKAGQLYERSLDVLIATYEWLEQLRRGQEEKHGSPD